MVEHHFPTPSNLEKVKEDAFAAFWKWLTSTCNAFECLGDADRKADFIFAEPVIPPPPPVGSGTLIPPLLSKARGVVLDIGPGSGSHVTGFSNNPTIAGIFGAEPSVGLHADLQERIDDAKLTGKYHILNSRAEKLPLLQALRKQDIQIDSDEQLFDTIVTIRVMCSVPDLGQSTRELYQLLKPGGQILVVEHVKNEWTTTGSILARSMQIIYHLLGWKFFLGGCHMNRDTAAAWKQAGAWAKVDLKRDFEWAPLTYVSGTLTKPL